MRGIAAKERVDDLHAQAWRRFDDAFQVLRHNPAMAGIRGEGIRIVAQAGDGHARLPCQLADSAEAFLGEVCDIEMADAGVAAVRASGRPAHQLDAGEALVAGHVHHLFQGQIAQDGADKTELHRKTAFPVTRR